MTPRSLRRLLVLAALSALGLGCNSRDVREWTPADHDVPPNAPPPGPPGRRDPPAAGSGNPMAELAEMTWGRQCQSCHGPDGRGDGPQGASVRASDLTKKEWQAGVSDEQMAAVIRSGKGRMPGFDLPAPVVSALVGRIRSRQSR